MRYRALDSNGDYSFGHGQSDLLINTPATVAQAIKTRLLLFTNEWFLDLSDGTAWLTQVLGKGTIGILDRILQDRILGTQGVINITFYDSIVDSVHRHLTVNLTVDTIYGKAFDEFQINFGSINTSILDVFELDVTPLGIGGSGLGSTSHIHIHLYKDAFKESEHPRGKGEKGGQFIEKESGNKVEKYHNSKVGELAKIKIQWSSSQKKNAESAVEALKKAGFKATTSSVSKVGSQFAAIGSRTNGIFINPRSSFWKNPTEEAKKSFSSGYLSTDDPMGVLYHEIAHTMYDPPSTWMSNNQKEVVKSVSKYATVNPKEFVSEVFAGIHSGKSYGDDIMRLYNLYT